MLQCAVRVPTALHEELCEFLVVQDKEVLKKISNIAKSIHDGTSSGGYVLRHFVDSNPNIFYDADTLIIILSKKNSHYVETDYRLAAENLMLVATSMGLGTCVIGSAIEALNLAFLEGSSGIPTDMRAICPITVVCPKSEIREITRHDPKVIA